MATEQPQVVPPHNGNPEANPEAGQDHASFASVGIKNSDINTAPGINLTPQQKLAVGSVLDLFEGRPSLKHLALWSPTATFKDPIALAQGYDQFAAQWYGLPALFRPIVIQSHRVTDGGNPLSFELSNKYVLKGLGQEKVMNSVVKISLGTDGKIEKVEDRWNDNLPEGWISEAFRKLNARMLPNIVKVPKTEEEDKKMMESRQK
jgi:hypothetical protein